MKDREYLFKAIIPFRPVVGFLLANLWHLRLFLLAILAVVSLSSTVFWVCEAEHILPNASLAERLKELGVPQTIVPHRGDRVTI